MDISVVSLKNALERRVHINKQFMTQQIEFQYFDAIEPHQIDEALKNTGIELKNCSLTKGEIGCFLSHLSLWKKIIDNNLPYMAIFEDDIYLGSEAKSFLKDNSWIPENVEVIKLEAFSDSVQVELFSKKNLINDRSLFLLKGRHLGTAGYIISNAGARNLFNYISDLDVLKPIDDIMFDSYIAKKMVYQMQPALCVQDFIYNKEVNFVSCLQSDRSQRHQSEMIAPVKINRISLKIKREIYRFFIQIYNLHYKIFEKKIEFK